MLAQGSHLRLRFLLLAAVLAGLSLGCTRYIGTASSTYYQTTLPFPGASVGLENILESVKQIRVTVAYETHLFSEDNAPLDTGVRDRAFFAQAEETRTADQTRIATAAVVSQSERKVVLLTARHVVQHPDTVVEYFERTQEGPLTHSSPRRIRSISILTRQTNLVIGLPDVHPFVVLAEDDRTDIALLGSEYPEDYDPNELKILSATIGESDRLAWGTFVYVLSYPLGYRMVTQGIVSFPSEEPRRSFAIDGPGGPGMSGGLVLAIRGIGQDPQELQWVGMVLAAATEAEQRLGPEEGAETEYEPWLPYEGPIYLKEVRRPHHGIVLSVPMHAIRRFIEEHRSDLQELGYGLPRLGLGFEH